MAPNPPDNLPFWLRPPALIAFVVAVLAIRFLVAGSTGLVRDEAYYTLWSLHLSPGYLDHPPMVAWLIAAGRALLGNGELAVRLFPVLSAAIVAFAVYRTGRLLFDAATAGLAVIWFTLTVATGLLFLATPDAPVVAFWALAVWAVAEFVARRNANWWLVAGLFAGLALLSKYTAFFLGAGLVLYLVTSRERRAWLGLWQLWAGGALALLILSPNLIWNAQNGWATFAFQGQRLGGYGTSLGSMLGNLGELIAGQALALGIFLFVFVLVGMFVFFRRRDLPGRTNLALPVFIGLPMLVAFLVYTALYRVEANWLLPVWPMLSLAGAWAAVHVRPMGGFARPLLAAMRWAQAPLGALLVLLLYVQALWHPFPLPPLVDRTSDMRGWAALQAEVTALAAANGARWIATGTDDYGLTGELVTYGLFSGETLPVRAVDHFARWRFLPPFDAALADQPALYLQTTIVGTNPPPQFANSVLLGEVKRAEGGEVLETFVVYLVSGPTAETVAGLTGE